MLSVSSVVKSPSPTRQYTPVLALRRSHFQSDLRIWRLLAPLMLILFTAAAAAQDDQCTAALDAARANILAHCAEQVAGTLCFGNPTVAVMNKSGANSDAATRFNHPGDLADLGQTEFFSTSSEARSWGAARAVFQAFPADSLAAETSNLLLIGDAAIFLPPAVSAPAGLIEVEVTASLGANLRTEPSTDARVIRPAAQRARLWALRRSEDGEWIQAYFSPVQLAWVSQSLVTGAIDALDTAQPANAGAPLWLTLQTFDFGSGLDDAPCESAPDSGIILQTPKYAPPRVFVINGVELLLSGTAYLQAQARVAMWVYLLDGEAQIATADVTTSIAAGAYTRIPLEFDADGKIAPSEAPAPAAPYDYNRMLRLPLDVLLYPTRVGLDPYTVIARRPSNGDSPLVDIALDAPCKISTGTFGARIRSRPDPDAPVIALMGYNESADPSARAIGADNLPWWKLGESIWIRIDATDYAGNCSAVPLVRYQN